ncbi:MAG TPA: hypothetical protein VKD67_12935 [Acidimicrobiales bacterium]|jgi:hypothetical protein|nr:hypothetical protein [Acidimicrobiales bacterium]
MTATWTILSPVATRPVVESSAPALALNRSIVGVRVGLEVDYAWISYITVIDEWEQLLKADGAEPYTLWIERSRDDTTTRSETELRADIEEWSRLIDCGVVGLGN